MTGGTLSYNIPREPGGTASIVLAILMHALLIAFLWKGTNWNNQPAQVVSPEIFTPEELNQPQDVEPVKPVKVEDPTPVRGDPEIAVAQEKQKLEQQRIEQEKRDKELEKEHEKELAQKQADEDKRKKEDEKKQQLEEQKKLQKMLAEDKARMMHDAGATSATPSAPNKAGGGTGDSEWAGKVTNKVHNLISFNPGTADPKTSVEFRVRLAPYDGSVISVQLTKSSGIAAFDKAVENAIYAAAPYPADKSGKVPGEFTSTSHLGDLK